MSFNPAGYSADAVAQVPDQPHVLIVEDEDSLRGLYAQFLTRSGYAVTAVSNGEAALTVFAAMPFRLVITDLQMPDVDGAQLILRLRRQDPKIPVIVISGSEEFPAFTLLEAARLLGATAGLAKPFHFSELLQLTREVLGARSGE